MVKGWILAKVWVLVNLVKVMPLRTSNRFALLRPWVCCNEEWGLLFCVLLLLVFYDLCVNTLRIFCKCFC